MATDTGAPGSRWGSENGQMLVTVALLSVVLFVLAAIATETALIWIQRRNLQNAADAAALAGAQRLPDNPEAAIADSRRWAERNVADLSSFEAEVFDANRAIRVEVRKPAATVFGGWFGYGGFTIAARAAARVAQPRLPGPGAVPLAITWEVYSICGSTNADDTDCEEVTLKQWTGRNDDPRSSYQLLDIDGRGINGLEAAVLGGSSQPITDPVDQQTGNTGRALADGLAERLAAAEEYRCLTWGEVTYGGKLFDRCNPLSQATRGALEGYPNVQPTAVIVIPVVKAFCQGRCDLDIVGDDPHPRTFALVWIDAERTRCTPPGGGRQGGGGQGGGQGDGPPPGQCWIVGRFITTYDAPISTYVEDGLGEFDDKALLKVIQLIE